MDTYLKQNQKYLHDAFVPVGLFGFAIPTFLLALFNMQAFHSSDTASTAGVLVFISIVGFVFGGWFQLYSGVKCVGHGHLKTGTIFVIFGGFWVVFSVLHFILNLPPVLSKLINSNGSSTSNGSLNGTWKIAFGIFLVVFGIICVYALYISWYKDLTITITFSFLIVAFFTLATSDVLDGSGVSGVVQKTFQIIGGVFSFLAGLCALYMAFSHILEYIFKANLLPLGKAPGLKKR